MYDVRETSVGEAACVAPLLPEGVEGAWVPFPCEPELPWDPLERSEERCETGECGAGGTGGGAGSGGASGVSVFPPVGKERCEREDIRERIPKGRLHRWARSGGLSPSSGRDASRDAAILMGDMLGRG